MAHRTDINKNLRRLMFELFWVVSPFIMVMMVRDVTQYSDILSADSELQVFSRGFLSLVQWMPFERSWARYLCYVLYAIYGVSTVCVIFHLFVFYAICIVECTARKWKVVVDLAKQLL